MLEIAFGLRIAIIFDVLRVTSCLQLKTPRWHIRNFNTADTKTVHLYVSAIHRLIFLPFLNSYSKHSIRCTSSVIYALHGHLLCSEPEACNKFLSLNHSGRSYHDGEHYNSVRRQDDSGLGPAVPFTIEVSRYADHDFRFEVMIV